MKSEILAVIHDMCSENLVFGTWGNVSVREGNCMWITPSGMNYDALKEQDLVKMSLDGQVCEGRWKPSSEWRLHAAIYRGRSDCHAIVHTHSVHATAFAVARTAIPPVVEDLVQVVGGGVDVADYALPGTEELAANTLKALGGKSAVILASHGLVGVAENLPEALKVCRIVEKTAQTVLLARLLGTIPELSGEDILSMRRFYQTVYGPDIGGEGKE